MGENQNSLYSNDMESIGVKGLVLERLKAGVNLKAVFMPIKIGFMEISRSRFKQSKISLLKTETNVIGCFVNF